MADPIFAVVGETIELYVEADDHFLETVLVFFSASVTDTEAKTQEVTFFEEALAATETAVRTPNAPPTTRASLIKWKVNVAKDERFRGRTATASFVVQGLSKTNGLPLAAISSNDVRIVSIGVTRNAACLRIMLHEFSNDDIGVPIVDRERLLQEVDKLTVAQRRLLLAHAKESPTGRLVVFITRIPSGGRRMRGDFGEGREAAIPNASFAVFACRDLEQDGISLVCFTEHFLLNTKNEQTRLLLASTQGGKPPAEWRSRDNPSPPKFRIASQLPGSDNDGLVWSCIYSANGKNVMKGNTMHGVLNTVGCWMLFRNFNWPDTHVAPFEQVYLKSRQMQAAKLPISAIRAAVQTMLIPLGYDVIAPPPTESSSAAKFAVFDRNWAYVWFFHDIVGVKYFSKFWQFGGDRQLVHDVDVTGRNFRKTFTLSNAGVPSPTNTADELGCTLHDFDRQLRQDSKRVFAIDDTLLRPNALGFQTTKKFIPQSGRFGDLTADQLEACAWADMYMYDDL